MKKRFQKIFDFFSFLLIIFIFLVALLFLGSKMPLPKNYQIFTVMSGSMEPAIKIGSIVLVKPKNDYQIGEIVTFKKRDHPITHRIVEKEIIGGRVFFTTKGDANKNPDPQKIQKNEILGRVIFSLPFLGYFVNFVRKPFGFLVTILIPALLVIGEEIKKIRKEIQHLKNKKGVG